MMQRPGRIFLIIPGQDRWLNVHRPEFGALSLCLPLPFIQPTYRLCEMCQL
jgi:hypothetical protein